MSASQTLAVINSWETIRYELLNTRICDLGLKIKGSSLEPLTRQLLEELSAKGVDYQPGFYLTDSWGCPDRVPIIGIPFYLADKRLMRIEEEQTGEVEDEHTVMMFLRHEAGHAINYAYRLWKYEGWADVFGHFTRPYRDSFQPNPFSRNFVRHLVHSQYRQTYAQKHPDEDFAETFAVWLTPGSAWRRKYQGWPVLRKLRYVDALLRQIRGKRPVRTGGRLCNPVEQMTVLLADHYGQRVERYRALAQGYVDDRLRKLFSPSAHTGPLLPAAFLLNSRRAEIIRRVTRWSGMDREDVETIVAKLEARSKALNLEYNVSQTNAKLMDIVALATSLVMDFGYTGRFTE